MSDTKCSTHPGAAGPDQENLMSLLKLSLFIVTEQLQSFICSKLFTNHNLTE